MANAAGGERDSNEPAAAGSASARYAAAGEFVSAETRFGNAAKTNSGCARAETDFGSATAKASGGYKSHTTSSAYSGAQGP